MKRLIYFVKKNWIMLLLLLVAVLYVVNLLIKAPEQPLPQSPLPKTATFNSLTPGLSTSSDVEKALGKPTTTITENGKTSSEYKSTNVNRYHKVVYSNDQVMFISEVVNSVDNKDVESIKKEYGEPPFTLYHKSVNVSFNIYVYPENGIAYKAHADGTILEIWYFKPTDLNNFMSTWAKDYSRSRSSQQSGY